MCYETSTKTNGTECSRSGGGKEFGFSKSSYRPAPGATWRIAPFSWARTCFKCLGIATIRRGRYYFPALRSLWHWMLGVYMPKFAPVPSRSAITFVSTAGSSPSAKQGN